MEKDRLKTLIAPVEPDLDIFDHRLAEFLKGDTPLITSIARHLMRSRGKRMRPALMFLLSRAAEVFTEHTISASLAIELIHTATLLHDDVVDDSQMRRGLETVNSKWTNLVAVLMGDFLFAKAFRMMVTAQSIELVSAISRATERVSVGELRQVEETSNYDLSEEEYLKIIADKTASLFAVSCEAAPILAGIDGHTRDKFAQFGEKVGVAFQIADDLLDFVGDADVTGKEPGNDVITGKVTLPLIYTLRNGDRGRRREIMKILGNGIDQGNFRTILGHVNEAGGIDYAQRRAVQIANEGLEMVKGLKDSVYFRSLSGMVEFSTSRAA
ncbi:MAG: polyprenyl synthetase family protein [Candidatus Zixiibacteriota bacterium]